MRYLAIDYGNKRTGLAICDPDETISTPLAVIEGQKKLIEKISYEIKLIEKKINKAETEDEKKELTLKQKELNSKLNAVKKELAAQYEQDKVAQKKAKSKTKEASI